jgi:hypothetical protein
MKTLTIRLPNALAQEIEAESRRRSVTKSDVVRERLQQDPKTTAAVGNMDEVVGNILRESWNAKVPAGGPRFGSANKQRLAELIRAKKLHH